MLWGNNKDIDKKTIVCYNTITQAKRASVAEVSPVKMTGTRTLKI